MYRQSNGVMMQIGVASFFPGQGCTLGYPSGFNRLRYYVDWIKSISGPEALIVQPFNSIMLTSACFLIGALRNAY